MDPIAAVQSAGRRRSLSNPFFQRTEEDVAKEAKADQMKDDLEKLYSSDKLPAAAGLAVALAPGEEMGEKLHSTRLWAWSGAVWKEHKAVLRGRGLEIKRVGFFAYERVKSWCEGRTVRQNDYLVLALAGEEDPMLVVWFLDNAQFVSFLSCFRGVWDTRKLK